jgi:hypothetical protein
VEELARVVRPGGTLVIAFSVWGGLVPEGEYRAQIRPLTYRAARRAERVRRPGDQGHVLGSDP